MKTRTRSGNWQPGGGGWLAGDTDLLISLYADDPVLMPQDQPAVRGKDAIRALYEQVFRNYRLDSDSTLMEVETSGDWGYFWSSYRCEPRPRRAAMSSPAPGKIGVYREACGGRPLENRAPSLTIAMAANREREHRRASPMIDEAFDHRSWHGTNLRGSIRGLSADEVGVAAPADAAQYLGARAACCVLEVHGAAPIAG